MARPIALGGGASRNGRMGCEKTTDNTRTIDRPMVGMKPQPTYTVYKRSYGREETAKCERPHVALDF
jgi:hypothetical protein